MEEKTVIEKLLDENNNDNIILYDENNNQAEFEQVAIIPLNDKLYAILKPATKIEGVNEDEALVFVLEETDDEESLVICDDFKVVDKVFEASKEALGKAGSAVQKFSDKSVTKIEIRQFESKLKNQKAKLGEIVAKALEDNQTQLELNTAEIDTIAQEIDRLKKEIKTRKDSLNATSAEPTQSE